MNIKAVYVTTPIYYVNDVPHIGHAYTTIAADVLARFYHLAGYQVLFATGVDEHGQKIERTAAKAGESPQQFCDRISQRFRDMSPALNLSEDVFLRTTEERHKKAAQAMWQRLVERNQIYKGSYAGWYSVRDETFFAESELVEGKAPTGSDVEWLEEPSYFFKLSEWQEPLLKYYEDNPDFIGPKSRYNEVVSFVKSGLHDLSVSRSSFKWGVPVPNDPDHVMYVWVEALTYYLTVLDFPNLESDRYNTFWPEATHLLGKDILRHHAVYWPAILMAADLPLPKRIFGHGWLTQDGEKMSRSLGNVIDPFALAQKVGVDPLRYFLMREVPFGRDGQYSEESFKHRINSDLANDLGNLTQRVLSFVQKHADAKVPEKGEFTKADEEFLGLLEKMPDRLIELADQQAINKMVELIWTVVSEANRFVDTQEPWALRKTDQTRMKTVLYVLMESLRQVAILAQPFMPDSCSRILGYLGIPSEQRTFADIKESSLIIGHALVSPEPVFPRIE